MCVFLYYSLLCRFIFMQIMFSDSQVFLLRKYRMQLWALEPVNALQL